MQLKDILAHPALYQAFQEAGGWFDGRTKAIRDYLPLTGREKIVDIGCGPGTICIHLPAGVEYHGFDPSEAYIRYANRHYPGRGTFTHGYFDEAASARIRPADVVLMNGVLHHMSDAECTEVIRLIKKTLAPGGRVFTLDPCFVDGQSPVARWLMKRDRGRHVRTEPVYRALMAGEFQSVETHINHDYSFMPWTFISMVGSNRAD